MFESNVNHSGNDLSSTELELNKSSDITEVFYKNIFESSLKKLELSNKVLAQSKASAVEVISTILNNRSMTKGLSIQDSAILLNTLRKFPDLNARNLIIKKARELRQKLYSNSVSTMIPIEVSSYCTSNCTFCGWRSDNNEMVRLKISEKAVIEQIESLAQMGFSHFEIATGDDIVFLKNNLESFIRLVKETAKKYVSTPRVSICVTPLHYNQYLKFKNIGLDTVLTWQETYQAPTFYKYVNNGPKAKGLTQDFKIDPNGDGHLQRMQSQESAVKAGLQVGLGVMIGLSDKVEADILAVIQHGQKLIEVYSDKIQPLIIGMPTWNAITTSNDNLKIENRPINLEENFELVAAIYLLSFPDYLAWVFPNCRVSIETQLASVKTAGVFTSTMVRVGPGAYLAADSNKDLSSYFSKSSIPGADLNSELILKGEQFVHDFHSHKYYCEQFESAGLKIISDSEVLLLGKS